MAGIEVQPYNPTNPLTAAQGAFGLANTIYQGQNIQANTALTNTQNQQAQTNLATGQMNRSFQVTAGLLNLPDEQLAGGQAVRDALAAEHQAGTIGNSAYQTALSTLPPPNQADGTPTPASAFRQVLTSHLLAAHSPADEYNRTVGTVQSTTLPGGMTQYVGVPGPSGAPGAPIRPIGSPVGGGMTPEASNDLITVTSPVSGRTVQIARQDAAAWAAAGYPTDSLGQPTGFDRSGPPQSYKAPPPPNPLGGRGPAPLRSGGGPAPTGELDKPIPSDLLPRNPDVIPTGGGTGGLPPPPPGIVTPPKPAQTSTGPTAPVDRTIPSPQDMEVAKNSKAYQQSEVAGVSGQDMINKNRALDTISNLSPDARTGKGTAVSQDLATVVSNISPVLAKSLGIDPTKQADRAELLKNMAQYQMSAGNGTDAKLIAAQASSPNDTMPPATAQAVARTLRGVNNYYNAITREAASLAVNDPKNLDSHFGNVRTQIAGNTDINAFLISNQQQLAQYLATLPPANTQAGQDARQKFKASKLLADKYAQPNSGAMPTPSQ